MIYINWIYKGCVIEVTAIDKLHTQRDCFDIRQAISAGKIKAPENHERYELMTSNKLNQWMG